MPFTGRRVVIFTRVYANPVCGSDALCLIHSQVSKTGGKGGFSFWSLPDFDPAIHADVTLRRIIITHRGLQLSMDHRVNLGGDEV